MFIMLSILKTPLVEMLLDTQCCTENVTLTFRKSGELLIKNFKNNSKNIWVPGSKKIKKCWGSLRLLHSTIHCFCLQGRAPAPRAAHGSAALGCRGYICGGRVMVRVPVGFQCSVYGCMLC